MFGLVVNALPEAARGRIFFDEALCAKFGIAPEFWFPLGPETSVETKSLYGALRAAIAGRKSAMLKLRDGRRARAKIGKRKGGQAVVQLKKSGFAFADADLLSSEKKARLSALRRAFDARPLTSSEEDQWQKAAARAAFADKEFIELMTGLESTPEAIRNQVSKPQNLDSENLMPSSPDYYFRLVGKLGESTTLTTYIGNELAAACKTLFDRHPTRALRRIGFLALWRPLIPFDLLARLGVSEITPLLDAEDPFSLLCGFELCCNRPKKSRAVIELGTSFLSKLLLDERTSRARCNIFSACAIISMTNIRRAAKAANAPLFWARLAALSHAGVLTDALRGVGDTKGFLRWSMQNWLPNYLWHGVIDRRDAPGWNPEWIISDQLYAELIGRALGALHTVPDHSRPASWVSAMDKALAELRKNGNLLSAHFPGPFDDFAEMRVVSSKIEVFKEVEDALEKASAFADVPALAALAIAAKPSEGVVANVLRLLSGPIDLPLGDDEMELPTLGMCAHIAASAGSTAISNAVINRCLFLLHKKERATVASDVIMVALHACAAQSAPEEHRRVVEGTLVRCAFAIKEAEDLSNFDLILEVLCIRDEKLTPAVARARAITRAKISRN